MALAMALVIAAVWASILASKEDDDPDLESVRCLFGSGALDEAVAGFFLFFSFPLLLHHSVAMCKVLPIAEPTLSRAFVVWGPSVLEAPTAYWCPPFVDGVGREVLELLAARGEVLGVGPVVEASHQDTVVAELGNRNVGGGDVGGEELPLRGGSLEIFLGLHFGLGIQPSSKAPQPLHGVESRGVQGFI